MAQMKQPKNSENRVSFGEPLSALVFYSLMPGSFQQFCSPRDALQVGSKSVLEQIVQVERNSEQFQTKDPSELAERIRLAEMDLRGLAQWSLWEALKCVTRLVVNRELTDLRVERLDGAAEDGAQFQDLVEVLTSKGIVDGLLEGEIEFKRWIEMCYHPDALMAAYQAQETFERSRSQSSDTQA